MELTIICTSCFQVVRDLRANLVSADAERIVAVCIAWGVAASAIKGAIHQIL